jgi:hypothetical protein
VFTMRSNSIHTSNSVTDVELPFKGLAVTDVFSRESEGNICHLIYVIWDRLCGLEVRVPVYRFKGPGLNPSATRFSESTQPREYN